MRINDYHYTKQYSNVDVSTFDWPSCCFDRSYVFKFDGRYFEYIGDFHEDGLAHHDFRVVLSEDDYDYVEDEDLNKRLLKAWKSVNIV